MGEARDIAERFYERFAAGDLNSAVGLFADGCVTVTPAGSLSNEEHKAFAEAFKVALPDAHMVPVRAVEAGNEVYISGRFAGTHTGDLHSAHGTVASSGNTIDFPFVDYFKVVDGKIVEHEVTWDQLGMMTQMGAAPGSQ